MTKIRELGAVEVFVSGRVEAGYFSLHCPVLVDLEPGVGPLGGIERGLHACPSRLLLFLAVDMPSMTAALLQKLSDRTDHLTGAVPARHGELEPLATIDPKRCHALTFEALSRSRRSARDLATACLRERAIRTLPRTRRALPTRNADPTSLPQTSHPNESATNHQAPHLCPSACCL
jgi:molybdopterin-guanine dinucleotide biosynthesis protein A